MNNKNKTLKAVDTFHHPEYRHNCAQAIVNKWHSHFNVPPTVIADMKACGGGRAPEGLCGALYGGLHLLQSEEEKEKLIDGFCKAAGQTNCRALKAEKRTSCEQCVDIADSLIEKVVRG